jgi:hypothetical protein
MHRIKYPWLTEFQVAVFLGRSPGTIKNMLADGRLKKRQPGPYGLHADDLLGLEKVVMVTAEHLAELGATNEDIARLERGVA